MASGRCRHGVAHAREVQMFHASDQAAGLRRLFRRAPAWWRCSPSGRHPAIMAQTPTALTEGARRVVVIDEHAPEHGSRLEASAIRIGAPGGPAGRIDVTDTMRGRRRPVAVPAAATV